MYYIYCKETDMKFMFRGYLWIAIAFGLYSDIVPHFQVLNK